VPDDTTSRPSKPTTLSSPHYLLGIFISGAALLPKEDQKARWKTNPEGTRRNSIQFRNETKIAYKRKYRQNTIASR
jgi:hypothetical protein